MASYDSFVRFRAGVEAAHAIIARIQRQRDDDLLNDAHEALRFVNAITGGRSRPCVKRHKDDDLAALMGTALLFIRAAIWYATAALPEIDQQKVVIAALDYARQCVTRAAESLMAVG